MIWAQEHITLVLRTQIYCCWKFSLGTDFYPLRERLQNLARTSDRDDSCAKSCVIESSTIRIQVASSKNGRKWPKIELDSVKVLLESLLQDKFLTLYENGRKILLGPPIELILMPIVPYSSPLRFISWGSRRNMAGRGLKLGWNE